MADELKSFFSDLALEFWRQAVPAAATVADVALLDRELKPCSGMRILDVPCGHGRLAIPLAKRGAHVVAIDFAESALASLSTQARGEHLAIETRMQDMRRLELEPGFDAAICMGNSFGYGTDAEQVAFLHSVAGALRTGGTFVLDTAMAAESILCHLDERMTACAGAIRVHIENQYDPVRSRLHLRYRFVDYSAQPARESVQHLSHAVYTTAHILSMLDHEGIVVQKLLGSAEGHAYALGAPRLIVIGRKAT